jgi:hypothetical protein
MRLTQNAIHTNFSTDYQTWINFRAEVIGQYDQLRDDDFNDHLAREFNKKIDELGLSEDLLLTPHDAGFRYIGVGVFGDDSFTYTFDLTLS